MNNKDITAIITSFRSENKILNCIKSLGKDFKIIVIENSNDNILKDKLEKDYPNLQCVLSDKNLGYAKGNNLGLSMVKTKYALIINPDAEVQVKLDQQSAEQDEVETHRFAPVKSIPMMSPLMSQLIQSLKSRTAHH